MSLSSATAAAIRTVKRAEFKFIAPLQFAARKRDRLRGFGIDELDAIPSAVLELNPANTDCAACGGLLRVERTYLGQYLRDARGAALFRPTPYLIDLTAYPDHAAYADAVRRHSKGGVLRQVRRARDQGFYCRRIAGALYHRQCFEIEVSKRFRSGPVLQAFLRPPPPSDFAGGITIADLAAHFGRPPAEYVGRVELPDPPAPVCPLHWTIDWGVLREEAVSGRHGVVFPERLAGFVFLRRAGNIVRTMSVMGHASYLSQFVMKLLFHDIIRWLLERQDPAVQGVRYFLYGALEHGGDGLAAWKRSFAFAPHRFGCIA